MFDQNALILPKQFYTLNVPYQPLEHIYLIKLF